MILSLDLSDEVVDCSCGILSTLAVLHRQRQNLDECDRVLDVYQSILKHYRAIAMRPRASQELRDSFWNHVYRQNHIRVNLAVNRHQQRHDMIVLRDSIAPLLRDLVAYEMDHNVPPQRQSYKFIFLGRQSSGRSDLQDMSDNELFDVYWDTVKRLGADTEKVSLTRQRHIELKECAHCHSHEPTRRFQRVRWLQASPLLRRRVSAPALARAQGDLQAGGRGQGGEIKSRICHHGTAKNALYISEQNTSTA